MAINAQLVKADNSIEEITLDDDPDEAAIEGAIGDRHITVFVNKHGIEALFYPNNNNVLLIGETPFRDINDPGRKRKSCKLDKDAAVTLARCAREQALVLRLY
jgi:hypothetical protein